MRTRTFTMPELMFVVATRAALAGGVALLLSDKFTRRQRKTIGTTLAAVGVLTTIPAAMIVVRKERRPPEKIEA